MTLISGKELEPKRFFKSGNPTAQGSSFDLTIGKIFDPEGNEVQGTFRLRPGHMVQVMSTEVFGLPNDITGHVTYKTSLTRIGIWALTVGIVDPGWTGPISTTLLNFSRRDYALQRGSAFLRVSFFKHNPVPPAKIRPTPSVGDYTKQIQELAVTNFAKTFLNRKQIERRAGDYVMTQIRNRALVWVGGVALVFTVLQLVLAFGIPKIDGTTAALSSNKLQLAKMQSDLDALKTNEFTQIRSELDATKIELELLRRTHQDVQSTTRIVGPEPTQK